MLRDLAEGDPARIAEISRWALRDGLLAFLERSKVRAAEDYRSASLQWLIAATAGSKQDPPEVPRVLAGR